MNRLFTKKKKKKLEGNFNYLEHQGYVDCETLLGDTDISTFF